MSEQVPDNQTVTYHLWTDGSLILQSIPATMSSAFMILKEDTSFDSYACAIAGDPSSKTAEITAIIMALRATPHDASHIHIYTDSMTAVHFIDKYLSSKRAMDNIYFAYRDDEPLMRTLHMELLKRQKALSVHKVLAHSGIAHNELVDQMASMAHSTPDSRDLSRLLFGRWTLRYNDYKYAPMRKAIKVIHGVARDEITSLYMPTTFATLTPEWQRLIIKTLRTAIRGKYFVTSLYQNKEAAFMTKFIFNKLALMNLQHAWYQIYLNNHCRRCDLHVKEDRDHMMTCPANGNALSIITDYAISTLKKIPDHWRECLHRLIDLNRTILLNALPSMSLINAVSMMTGNDLQKTIKIIKTLMLSILKGIYLYIWRPRCVATSAWEDRMGLTATMRRLSTRRTPYYTQEQLAAKMAEPLYVRKRLLTGFLDKGFYSNMSITHGVLRAITGSCDY